ncbi:hypothetical protein NQ314_009159 [Rhamnusium bicolor]|uniref:Uncharacterized protein n=1 Tax=Rhamnusium bicolor TaxID=1586634 RepID=A0AAV8Y5V9_9CUCU|nr:hypothetical protein NQ314_009159 [Rhamnusium bicolor]
MDLNFSVFQEPRGVMRILHFVFSICAFATITGYTGHIKYNCLETTDSDEFSYPFQFAKNRNFTKDKVSCAIPVVGDFSSDAQFFCCYWSISHVIRHRYNPNLYKICEIYKTNSKIPLYVRFFLITVVFGVLWLSSSAAWANGLTGLKNATNPRIAGSECKNCTATATNFSTLNISVIFWFLKFLSLGRRPMVCL